MIGKKMNKKRTSKFIRKYGMTLAEMAEKYNCSTMFIYVLDARDQLHNFIVDQETKIDKDEVKKEADCS